MLSLGVVVTNQISRTGVRCFTAGAGSPHSFFGCGVLRNERAEADCNTSYLAQPVAAAYRGAPVPWRVCFPAASDAPEREV